MHLCNCAIVQGLNNSFYLDSKVSIFEIYIPNHYNLNRYIPNWDSRYIGITYIGITLAEIMPGTMEGWIAQGPK